MSNRSQMHAKIFEVRGRQVLAHLIQVDGYNGLQLKMWIDEIDGPLDVTLNPNSGTTDEARDEMEEAFMESFADLDEEKVSNFLEAYQVWDIVDQATGQSVADEAA